MDFFNIKKYILLYLKNLPGWTTPRKIVVFISDDWGDQRIKDEVSYQRLLQAGIPVDKSHHTKYGALFTFEDLFGLYEVLSSFKDINGRYAVFTPFMVMANPDFRKIENSLFEKYYYEVFADTLIKQTEGDKTLAAMMEGMRLHLFEPEFHGRDHLNVPLWLKHLKKGDERLNVAFRNSYAFCRIPSTHISLAHAFYFETEEDIMFLNDSIKDGIVIFRSVFNRAPKVFNPPNGLFHPVFYNQLAKEGLLTIATEHFRLQPSLKGRLYRKYYRFGEVSDQGIIHLISNCAFEPVSFSYKNIDITLAQIRAAFDCRKPALINTHCVNYIGSRNPVGRDRSFSELYKLIAQIKKNWPDVEFMSAGEFADYLIA